MSDLIPIILTSVVVSSAISSLITGIFIFFNERSKKNSEEKRLRMEIACKLTELHDNKVVKLFKISPNKVLWRNHSKTFKDYCDYLEKVWNKKKVSEDFDSPIPD